MREIYIFQRDLESGAFKYFPRVKLLFNEASRENIEQHVAQFVEFLKSVIDQFSSRFLQFRQVEKTIQLIMYPDEIEFTDLKLDEFEWLDLKDLEMQLLDFQSNPVWKNKFVNLRAHLELELN